MSLEERRAHFSALGKKRAQAFTPAYQRAARKRVSPESCAKNGAKGAERTIALHGHKLLFEASRQKRLANPSSCELVMMGLLKTLDLFFVREEQLGETLFTLDFYLPKFRLGIEVDGPIHDAGMPGHEKKILQAERKEALCGVMGINLIRIHHTELADSDLGSVINKIREIAGARGAAGYDGREIPALV